MSSTHRLYLLPEEVNCAPSLSAQVADDYEQLSRTGLPASFSWEDFLLDSYRVDVSTEYAGIPISNPWGKASGQLSLSSKQVEDDVEAGLGFIVLKTVIAEDATGAQSMKAWAIPETRMLAEEITGKSGERGWTISWKGRGWYHSFEKYLELITAAQQIAENSNTLIVPSCKYHLPTSNETEWNNEEYRFTTNALLNAWQSSKANPSTSMPLEKDFSPTLAGSDLATQQATILKWLKIVPNLIRQSITETPNSIRIGLKLFNALFDDDFQLQMLRAIHDEEPGSRTDFFIYGNRLFDPNREFDGKRGIAYGGPDLSDRNLRIMSQFNNERLSTGTISPLPWSATGNIQSGKMALEYALRGASSFQIHTYFQLPSQQFRLQTGNKTSKALLELYLHPQTGLVVWLHHLASLLGLPSQPIMLRDMIGLQPRMQSH